MKRTHQLFYWISGDPPFDSYELTIHAEDGEPLPTASALKKTMVATNDRLAGKFLRMWKVSIPARSFDELVNHPLDPSKAILPPERMDLYLKDPPTFGHISFIVQAVKKGEVSEAVDPASSKCVQGGENVAGSSERVVLETGTTTSTEKTKNSPGSTTKASAASETIRTSVPVATVRSGKRIIKKKPIQSDSDDEDFSYLESLPAPSKRARLDDSSTESVEPTSSGRITAATASGRTIKRGRYESIRDLDLGSD